MELGKKFAVMTTRFQELLQNSLLVGEVFLTSEQSSEAAVDVLVQVVFGRAPPSSDLVEVGLLESSFLFEKEGRVSNG